MSPRTDPARSHPGSRPIWLADRIRARRDEIEQAALARVYAISDPAEVEDPDYVAGLREAVSSGLAYALVALEGAAGSETASVPAPVQLLAQARHAARSGVPLDTVLRRHFAGYTLFGDFLTQAADECALSACELQRAMRRMSRTFENLVAAVSEEYVREAEDRPRTAAQRRASRVRMLLSGEPVDVSDLGYELDAWHLGAIATGPSAQAALRELATELDRRLLEVRPDGEMVWAWLGGRRALPSEDILGVARASWSDDRLLALGEPGRGLEGWRLSHRQAREALSVARLGPQRQVSYAKVALLATMIQDEVLSASLPHIFLDPLATERDGGVALRQTLRAYFATERNVSSAAADLGVSRRTVSSRLHRVEERLGRPIHSCGAELEAALRLDALHR